MPSNELIVWAIVIGVVVIVAIFVLRPILRSIRLKGMGLEAEVHTHDRPLGRAGDATMEGVKGRNVQNTSETGGAATMRNVEAEGDVSNLSTNRGSGESPHPKS